MPHLRDRVRELAQLVGAEWAGGPHRRVVLHDDRQPDLGDRGEVRDEIGPDGAADVGRHRDHGIRAGVRRSPRQTNRLARRQLAHPGDERDATAHALGDDGEPRLNLIGRQDVEPARHHRPDQPLSALGDELRLRLQIAVQNAVVLVVGREEDAVRPRPNVDAHQSHSRPFGR
jgi:hypothetical protein